MRSDFAVLAGRSVLPEFNYAYPTLGNAVLMEIFLGSKFKMFSIGGKRQGII